VCVPFFMLICVYGADDSSCTSSSFDSSIMAMPGRHITDIGMNQSAGKMQANGVLHASIAQHLPIARQLQHILLPG